MNVNELIQQANDKKAEARRENMREYRGLLEQANAGELDAPRQQRLLALIENLGLAEAQVTAHAESLQATDQYAQKKERLAALDAKIADLGPRIRVLADKRAEVIAGLDAELQPLLHENQVASGEAQSLRVHLETNRDREIKAHPELYHFVRVPKPAPRREQSEFQATEAAKLGGLIVVGANLVSGVISSGLDRQSLSFNENSAIEATLIHGITLADRPITRESLPASQRDDPRPEMCRKAAKKKAAGYEGEHLDFLVEQGIKNRWITPGDCVVKRAADGRFIPERTTAPTPNAWMAPN